MNAVIRLAALCALAGLFLASLTPADAQQSPVTIRASTIPSTDNGAFESARAKGFFAQQGLTVDTTPVAGGAVGIPALLAGHIQIASSNIVSIILAASQGLDVLIVGGGDTTSGAPPDPAGLVVPANGAPVKTGKDLENKRVAVNARNNILWLYAREWVAKTGGDPSKVNFIEVPFPQMVDAVKNGRVDAAMLVEPFLSGAVKSGTVSVVAWPFNAASPQIPIAEFVTTKSYAKANPKIIDSFVRGLNQGVDWATANKTSDEFFKIVAGYTGVSPDALRGTTIPVFVKQLDPAKVDFTAGLMKKNGLLKDVVDGKSLLYPAIMASSK